MIPASCLQPVRPLLSPRSLTWQRANPEMRGHRRPQEPPGDGWPLWWPWAHPCAPPTHGGALAAFQLPVLLKGTSDDDAPCPGYLFEEIAKISHESLGSSQCLLEYLLNRLHSGSGRVKLKVLKIMLHLCAHGSSSFLLILKRNPAFIQEAAGFTGPPDPLHGNSLYQQVRAAAQDLGSTLFSDTLSPPPPSQPPRALPPAGMGSQSRPQGALRGFGYSREHGPTAARHQPGQAGGGWDEQDSSPGSQGSCQDNGQSRASGSGTWEPSLIARVDLFHFLHLVSQLSGLLGSQMGSSWRTETAEPSPAATRVGQSDLLTDTVPFAGGPASLQPLSSTLLSPRGPAAPPALGGCPLPGLGDARKAEPRLAGSRDQEPRPEQGRLGSDAPNGGPESGLEPSGCLRGPGTSSGHNSLFAGMQLVACPRLVEAGTGAQEPPQPPWTLSHSVAAPEPPGSEPSAFAFLNS
ncbi:PREDICTED: AP-4 complex accessory subunit tepsin [Myotis brandtii]|uniref:AP-4 complex accessory subunit tepsin n=1 Tax=Myotis brandtii TaxID=109478 RepID=UPI0003BBB624|nr:PREDICTED: AP-4 complex accessory subunit tepsin [Myotis brandtii]